MGRSISISRRIFSGINSLFLILIMLICILPFIHLLAISLSVPEAANAGEVKLLPIGFNTEAYKYLWEKSGFIPAFIVTLKRLFLGTILGMVAVIITAYPLSKEAAKFKARKVYVWYFIFTMFFGGGLIPYYMLINSLGMLNTIWVLVVPTAVAVGNVLLLMNFFRTIPKELEEAAIVDGAGQITILVRVFLPVAKPALATVLLFTIIGHWNSWFDGIIFMNTPENYPLQSYLATMIIQNNKALVFMTPEMIEVMKKLSEKTVKAAQIFMGMLPIMLVYPFLQGYFVKGLVLGSVKG